MRGICFADVVVKSPEQAVHAVLKAPVIHCLVVPPLLVMDKLMCKVPEEERSL